MVVSAHQKQFGAYYTPDAVVKSLVRWAVRSDSDRLLDPSCGDGRFLVEHENSVGVEQDVSAAAIVHERAPGCLVHEGDFFSWAESTHERFECAAGNPPFIRYQRFAGEVREVARRHCAKLGAAFSGLASSWAPFLVATAGLLKPGGRMAFVVPAEIGHARYARPVLEFMMANFRQVQVVAVRTKLFPELSEDCWLLFCDGFGASTDEIVFSVRERFREMKRPPDRRYSKLVGRTQLEQWSWRLRPFLLSDESRESYEMVADHCVRLGDVARVGIGYVTGANSFFHLTPSEAEKWRIPKQFLVPTVRNGRVLKGLEISPEDVRTWLREDAQVLLLRIPKDQELPRELLRYLGTAEAKKASEAYKCRMRSPWYSVPDVVIPDAFLSYMSGGGPKLVHNSAGCTATNSVHTVRLSDPSLSAASLVSSWNSATTQLSCEIEGHPLGGGMLKVEPREASNVLVDQAGVVPPQCELAMREGIDELRRWRHVGQVS